jgi:hypothetical protein
MFKRRLGLDPHRGGQGATGGASGCPDIWELDDGNFAVIGLEQTSRLQPHLPPTASCGHDENIVVIPRGLLVHVRDFIPEE